ncbi:TrbI/VirB10 family protein [Acinetobacter sp. DSM 11652]|uniref:TrbI/VirB10 family protein n=1 Tax=Acinetobacter sp. DSM 11652 TaxID=346222 RepID=UPI0008CBFDB2|nr:TrbI/VirB10 family protein [Acinetobacter sp. DSM 11652]SEM30330.1 type IV secretion system protein VirB10 [Acinetobacter sp. DSM 11652]
MTDNTNPKVEASPDYFEAPKKGQGVRRLNRTPILVIVGLLLLAVAGVSYTYFSRVNAASGKNSEPPAPPQVTGNALPPVKPEGDMFAEMPTPPPEETITEDPTIPAPAVENNIVIEPPQQSEAMTARLRQISQLEDGRLNEFDQALKASTKVEKQESIASGQAQGISSNGRLDAQQLMQQYAASNGAGGGANGFMPQQAAASGMAAANGQAQKRAFLTESLDAETYLGRERKAALVPNVEIKAGTVIPGVLISGINSDLPGQIVGQVRQAVYDSATGQNLLIPSGAKLIGTYDSGITLGQSRALVVWQRIIYPDGSSLSLDNMTGADKGGYGGFSDKVNNHYGKMFASAIFLSAFSAGVQLSQPQAQNGENYSASQTIAGALGQQLGQLGMKMAERNMDIQPTIQIRPGYQFNIMVNKDIILPPWEGHPMAQRR